MAQTDETIALTLKRTQFWETHRATDFNSRQHKILQLLLDDFFGKLTVSKYAKITKVSTDTSLRDIQDLMGKVLWNKKEVVEELRISWLRSKNSIIKYFFYELLV